MLESGHLQHEPPRGTVIAMAAGTAWQCRRVARLARLEHASMSQLETCPAQRCARVPADCETTQYGRAAYTGAYRMLVSRACSDKGNC